MLVARFEPENNIETILSGFIEANPKRIFLVVGNYGKPYGAFLRKKFNDDRIKFVGYILPLMSLILLDGILIFIFMVTLLEAQIPPY